jgi:hypothetical protein
MQYLHVYKCIPGITIPKQSRDAYPRFHEASKYGKEGVKGWAVIKNCVLLLGNYFVPGIISGFYASSRPKVTWDRWVPLSMAGAMVVGCGRE